MKVSIYVIQYNKPEFLELQYNLLKKYCKDDFEYIVVNNGKDEENVNIFHKFCIDNNIREIQTFQNRIPNTQDHTRALKYIYDEFLSKDMSDFRTIIDHDIFPFGSFSIANIMENYEVSGIRLGGFPYYISSFIIIFNKLFDVTNIDMDIHAKQDATTWTYGISNSHKTKWLKHTTQGYREIYYIFKNHPAIIEEYNRLDRRDITFQIIENNLLHYWQGSEWNKGGIDFHKTKLDFIKFIIDDVKTDQLILDNNVFYDSAIIHEWLNPTSYPLNKIDENEYI